MKKMLMLVLFVLIAGAKAEAQVVFQTGAPNPNGGLLFDVGQTSSDESREIQYEDPNVFAAQRIGVAQNFVVGSNFTMDKYAFQIRGISDAVVLPSGDTGITVTLWDLDFNISNYQYPSAGGSPIATWNLTIESANEAAAASDWLIIDTPNIALSTGVNYGIQLGFTAPETQPGEKIWAWISNPFANDTPSDSWAIRVEGDPSLDASYLKTWRSQNFAIIGVPEPATMGLLMLSSLCFLGRGCRRK